MESLKARLGAVPVILSLLALFVALGGPSYAAGLISGKQIKNASISGKKLKKSSVGGRAVKESALGKVPRSTRADSATTADSAATAASASTATRAASADTAGQAANSDRLGGVAAGEYTRRLYAVYDASTNSIVRGAGALSVEPGGGPGVPAIRFNRDISGCAYIATRGPLDAANVGSAGFISTELASTANDQVIVRTRDENDSFFEAVDFTLLVVC